jgi:hypothetical protein
MAGFGTSDAEPYRFGIEGNFEVLSLHVPGNAGQRDLFPSSYLIRSLSQFPCLCNKRPEATFLGSAHVSTTFITAEGRSALCKC